MNTIQKRPEFSLFPEFSETFIKDFFSNRFINHLPAVNIREDSGKYEIEVAAPGLKKENFNICVENNSIKISAQEEKTSEDKKENYSRMEYNYNSFSRSFTLPENIKADDIKAKYADGILKITLPKLENDGKDSKEKKIIVS